MEGLKILNDKLKEAEVNTHCVCYIEELDEIKKSLDKYHKIEQELGIPLEVLLKALKDGIYCVRKEDERPYIYFYEKLKLVPYDNNYLLSVYDEDYEETFVRNLKDYGKTWALTREELENAKD